MMRPILLAVALSSIGCQRNQTEPGEGGGGGRSGPTARPMAVAKPATAAPALAAPAGAWRDTPLGRDVERVCNVLTYTGTTEASANDQLAAILDWLPKNIESDAGHDFLASIANLDGSAKADALDAGARRVGLTDCPLSLKWRE